MTNFLRPRTFIIGLTVIAALGGAALHDPSTVPMAAAGQTAAVVPQTTEPPFPGVVVDTPTATPSAPLRRSMTPPPDAPASTTSTSIVSVPATSTSNMHARQPVATLHSRYGSTAGTQSSTCWRYSETQSLCACGPGWDDPAVSIDAEPGEALPVSFDRTDAPRKATFTVADSYDGDALSSGELETSDVRITMPTRPGTYWISTGTWWPEGDVQHIFKVNVQGTQPATAKGSILGRTDGDPAKTVLRLTGPRGRTIEITPDASNRYRFDELPAGTYDLEATIESHPSYAPPGEPQVGTARRTERRTVELSGGEIQRQDFGADA